MTPSLETFLDCALEVDWAKGNSSREHVNEARAELKWATLGWNLAVAGWAEGIFARGHRKGFGHGYQVACLDHDIQPDC